MFIISSNLYSHHKTVMITVHLFSSLRAQVILSPNKKMLCEIFVTGRWRSQTVCLTGEKQTASGV